MSYLDNIRDKYKEKGEEDANKGYNNEWVPDYGEVLVRLLPPVSTNTDGKIVDDPTLLPYQTHTYHFLPFIGKNGKGEFIYSHKFYNVERDGKIVRLKDPIDEAVADWYDESRRTKNDELSKLAGNIKRKTHYFANIIFPNEQDPEKKFTLLKDTSNKGRLVKKICITMGLPFYKDIEGKIVDNSTTDVEIVYDLVDINEGRDFKIIKHSTGPQNYDFSYDNSSPKKDPRPLTDEEKELLNKRIDLRNYIQYEENYDVVKNKFEEFLAAYKEKKTGKTVYSAPNHNEGTQPQAQATYSPNPSQPQNSQEQSEENSAQNFQALLNEID